MWTHQNVTITRPGWRYPGTPQGNETQAEAQESAAQRCEFWARMDLEAAASKLGIPASHKETIGHLDLDLIRTEDPLAAALVDSSRAWEDQAAEIANVEIQTLPEDLYIYANGINASYNRVRATLQPDHDSEQIWGWSVAIKHIQEEHPAARLRLIGQSNPSYLGELFIETLSREEVKDAFPIDAGSGLELSPGDFNRGYVALDRAAQHIEHNQSLPGCRALAEAGFIQFPTESQLQQVQAEAVAVDQLNAQQVQSDPSSGVT